MLKLGIILVAYKYENRIERLLGAIKRADYDSNDVLLCISIDKSDNEEVLEVCERFVWEHGEKVIVANNERVGLRNHIIQCGGYIDKYNLDAVVVLEDDMYPATDFFDYFEQVSEKYASDPRIAGASLYKYSTPRYTDMSFIPIDCGYDAFFVQYASSWGQIWFKNQWNEFRKWYEECKDKEWDNEGLPWYISQWGDNSWLKYHIKYCVENDKYFVYPMTSHATNFGDFGEHFRKEDRSVQVPITACERTKKYSFPELDITKAYDVFFERQYINVRDKYGKSIEADEITIDLFGEKELISTRFLLSSKVIEATIIGMWGKKLLPLELNILYDIAGTDLFLYDLGSARTVVDKNVVQTRQRILYQLVNGMLDIHENEEMVFGVDNMEIKTIGIYGYGNLGKHFEKCMKKTGIEVLFIADESIETDYRYFFSKSDIINHLPKAVDLLVVTPIDMSAFQVKELEKTIGVNCISLYDFLLSRRRL